MILITAILFKFSHNTNDVCCNEKNHHMDVLTSQKMSFSLEAVFKAAS